MRESQEIRFSRAEKNLCEVSARTGRTTAAIAGASLRRALFAALLLPLLFFPTSGSTRTHGEQRQITIGVRAHLGEDVARARWQPTIDALNAKIENTVFQLVPYGSPSEIVAAAAQREFDYVITDPSSFVQMEVLSGVKPVLSLVNQWDGLPLNRFGSVVFTRKENSDILSLQDMRGRSVMGVAPKAFGGWQMVVEEFHEAGIDPARYFSEVAFADGNQQNVVFAVRDGLVETGVVRTGTLERMDAMALIDIDQFHIIGNREVPGFPFFLSTDLYPEWVLAQSPGARNDDTRRIAEALLSIGSDDPAATLGSYLGWQDALDYWPVHLLLQDLNAAPYENFGRMTFAAFVSQNSLWLASVALALVSLILALSLAVRRGNLAAREKGEVIRDQASELKLRETALNVHAMVSITDPQGKIIYANDKFAETCGYSRDELIGETHGILNSGEHDNEFFADLWRTIRSGRVWTGEIRNRRKDGSTYWVQSTIVPQRDLSGKIKKYISVRTDITQSKAAQKELNLKEFLEYVPGEVYKIWLDDHSIFYANSAAQRATGLDAEELNGQTLFEFLEPEDAAVLKERLHALTSSGPSVATFELDRKMPCGRRVATQFHVQYIRHDEAKPRFIATLHDISGYSKAKDQVAQLKATLDEFDEEVFMFWPETRRFFYVNKAARERIGLSEEEIYRMTPSDLEDGLSESDCCDILRPMIEGERSRLTFRREIDTGTNEPRVIEYDVKLVRPTGRRPRFVAILSDVTAQAAAEDQVRQLKHSLDLIQNELYMFWPDSYEFTYLNRAALRRVGWKKNEWRGRHTWDNITKTQQAELDKKCRKLIAGPERSVVFELTDRNGTPLEIYLHLIEPAGEKPRFVSVYRDISDQKQAETAKAQFISTVSHELRTPLTSIKGSLGLIKAGVGAADPDKLSAMIDIAFSNTEQLTCLVNDILDWEKIEANQMTYHKEEVDLVPLLQEAIEANRGYGQQFGVEFALALPKEPVPCHADRGRILQVMANLLSNAAKFSRDGTKVDVALISTGDEARISVRDYGIGIPADSRATIFERFTQADSSDVRKQGGTGLGLSISRAIVEAHGGTIDFFSTEGRGTTFFFRLPLLAGAAPNLQLPAPTTEVTGMRVLVCNACPDTSMALWWQLEQAGYQVSLAPTMSHARQMLHTGSFDGVTLDVGLPENGALHLLSDIRLNPATAQLPVVLVAAHSKKNINSLSGSAVAIADWLTMPMDQQRLHEAVRMFHPDGGQILYVGRDSDTRAAISDAVGKEGEVGHAATISAARQLLSGRGFDLVILDIDTGQGDCSKLLAQLDQPPQNGTPVLAISRRDVSDAFGRRAPGFLAASRANNADLAQAIARAFQREETDKRPPADQEFEGAIHA